MYICSLRHVCCDLIQIFVTLNPRLREGGGEAGTEGGGPAGGAGGGNRPQQLTLFLRAEVETVADRRLSVRLRFVDLRPDKMKLSPVLLLPAVLACLFLLPTSCDEQRLPEGTDRHETTPTSRYFPTYSHTLIAAVDKLISKLFENTV